MNFDDVIQTRRSIRSYKSDIPGEEIIKQLVTAARCAPSPSNLQPVRFILLESTESRSKLEMIMRSGYETLLEKSKSVCEDRTKLVNKINFYWRYSSFIFNAPLLFAVVLDESKSTFNSLLHNSHIAFGEHDERLSFDISSGLSIGNFINKACDLGLGSCVLTAPLDFIAKLNDIPGVTGKRIVAFITVGYPNESPSKPERVDISKIISTI